MKFRFGAIALALLLVVAATGCGSKKKAAVTTSAPPPATTTNAAATTTSGGGSTTTTTTTSSSTGKSPSFASAKDCAQLEGLGQKFSAAIAASATGKTPNYDEEIKLFKALADAAPSAIHGDLETISDAFSAEVGALKKANLAPGKTPTPAQLAILASASKSFSSAKVQAASKHLEAYGESHCGVKG
jgi:hypothetical protein